MEDFMKRYQQWCTDPCFDDKTKAELAAIADQPDEIRERFFQDLEFGTGGLRGIIGAGSNRLNIYTVGRATQGLANYIQKAGTASMGVAIAYDSRNMSAEFAQAAGLVLAANGIKANVYPSLRPTPMLSFAVRELGCTAGIVITASHNPPEYNGYKVYWADGAQVSTPQDQAIIDEVNAITDYGAIRTMDLEAAKDAGLYAYIPETVDEAYDAQVLAQRFFTTEETRQMTRDFSIVYTPLHGSGNLPVRRVLEKAGFASVHVVPQQELPDGNFTTVGYPNPENPDVFVLAEKLAKETGAELIVGTDPDCDRVGAVVKDETGAFTVLTGNMVGTLLTDYILARRQEKGQLPADGVVIKTIVSTEMIRPICAHYGVEVMDVLTGFKYIGGKIKEFEEKKNHTYLFGFEESYGCLAGTYARDKDAVVASLLICEMAAYYKTKGMTLYDALLALYEKYGIYREFVKSITLKGISGMEKIGRIMNAFRQNTPAEFSGIAVAEAKDYQTGVFRNMTTGEESSSPLPKSNVLYYNLADGTWICIRPSGTEPKLKFYLGVKADTLAQANKKSSALAADIDNKISAID